ncbi:MAG: hypothetical protein IGS48_19000 [Oscillatoriales cyanobacterium C42_A2020_001]|nr:hypothetical protein [Leptolyngbyaceae cyanobacterium C42_A2020_001]
MRCIRCGTDNSRRDRLSHQGRCKHCHHLFAFDPQTMMSPRFTDRYFQSLINKLSASNTLYFTKRQFLYCFQQRYYGRPRFPYFRPGLSRTLPPMEISGKVGVSLLIIGVLLAFLAFNRLISPLFGVGAFLVFPGLFLMRQDLSQRRRLQAERQRVANREWEEQQRRQKPPAASLQVSEGQIEGWLRRWQEVNGAIEKLLAPPKGIAEPVAVEPDVTQYSFDRLVICDRDSIAQLLIANNFHFERNCAIVSINGYPPRIFDTVMDMVRRNPALKVYVLHDCTATGIACVEQIRTEPNWFQNSPVSIVDVGLVPAQVSQSQAYFYLSVAARQEVTPYLDAIRSRLTEAELDDIVSGRYVELEAFTPRQLIQILNRAIQASERGDSNLAESNLPNLVVLEERDRFRITDRTFLEIESFG